MSNKFKNISTKNCTFYFIYIKNFHLKDPKNIFIYYIRYVTIKYLKYLKINTVNLLYLIFNKSNEYFLLMKEKEK